ncbi:MAG TPA: efflux RND transporter permease subunit, partial [Chitinophagaceae bacterium]|nr:efflux RND transporter permease subunit [Chitinophagaceae bacterium]
MWQRLAKFILKYRFPLLFILIACTALMGYWASKVELSYEFARAIPTNHPASIAYKEFKKKFGEDGNLLVIGIQTNDFFTEKFYNEYNALYQKLKKVDGIDDVIGIPSAVNLIKNAETEKLNAIVIFPEKKMSQAEIDSCKNVFLSLPFYKYLFYNPETNAWLMGVHFKKEVINSKKRDVVTGDIKKLVEDFGTQNNIDVHLSGLPFIRTDLSLRIVKEMRLFLVVSVILSALILLLFFRSISSTLLSLAVVIVGVIWSMGIMHLFGYKITLLTGLIPPLIVVIGIPNCIYFLNKFHTAYNDPSASSARDKKGALTAMITRMGIVTLFCNLSAGIGFAVFALTRSEVLKEFGAVAGISILLLFFISLILIPVALSLFPSPKSRHMKYLENARLN